MRQSFMKSSLVSRSWKLPSHIVNDLVFMLLTFEDILGKVFRSLHQPFYPFLYIPATCTTSTRPSQRSHRS